MKIPRHWVPGEIDVTNQEGQPRHFRCWGWSDTSPDEARRRGEERAQRAAERWLRGEAPQRYGYADGPLREEILEEMSASGSGPAALITRNFYGCRVLNTAQAMFVDIDRPAEASGGGLIRGLKSLFGKQTPSREQQWEAETIARVEALVHQNREIGLRIYRTKGGLRLLLTHDLFDPKTSAAQQLMESYGADPLYVTLCRVQECFRARLTPKPWRVGHTGCPVRYPWSSPEARRWFEQWEQKYVKTAERFATCRFLRHVGNRTVHEAIEPLVKTHDRLTRATSEMPLA